MILIYGGYQALDLSGDARAEQIGVVVAFVGYLATFFDPIQQLSNLYTTYQQGMAALDKIFDLLDTDPDLTDKPGAIDPRPLRGEIELDGVWFSYGRDKVAGVKRSSRAKRGEAAPVDERAVDDDGRDWAMRDVSVHIPAGETLALVGETGAGKGTFAKLVARFYDPQRGRVLVDGHDLRELKAQRLRSQLGIVPQEASCSAAPSARTSTSAARRRRARRSRPQRTRSARASSSGACRTGSRPRWASAASRSRPGSGR